MKKILALLASVLLCALDSGAIAADATWSNASGGTWSGTSNWAGGVVADGTNATANFSTLDLTSAATVTLGAPVTIGSLLFGDTTPSNNWIVSGSAMTLAVTSGAPTIQVNNQAVSFNSALLGSQGFTKTGAGTMYINATNNSLTGPITVNAGTLAGGYAGNTFGGITGDITVAAGAGFGFNGIGIFNATTYANNIFLSGTGSSTGFGALEIGGNASVTGTITLNADARITHNYNIATISGPITGVNKSLTLSTFQSSQYGFNVNGNISLGSGGLIVNGVGTGGSADVSLSGSNSYSGGTQVNSGALYISSTNALPGWNTGAFRIASGAALVVPNAISDSNVATLLGSGTFVDGANFGFDTGAGNRTYSANIADTTGGALGIVKRGGNTLTLSGSNTYTGPTIVIAGTLKAGGPNAFSTGTLGGMGGTIDLNGSNFSVSGLAPNGANIGGGTLTLNGPIVKSFNGGTPVVSAAIDLAGGDRVVSLQDTSGYVPELTLSGSIGNGALTLNNAAAGYNGFGTLYLAGTNNYAGGTTISSGALSVNNGSALGSGTVTIGTDGSLLFGGMGIANVTGVTVSNPLVINRPGGGAWNLAIQNYSGANTLSGPVNLQSANTPIVVTAGTLTMSGAISGAGGLNNLSGTSGMLVLSGSNSYSGATTLSTGTLRLGSSTGVPTASALSVNGGVFDLDGNNFTTTSLGAGNAAGTLTDNSALPGTTSFTSNGILPTVNTVFADGANGRKLAVTLLNIGLGNANLNSSNTFSGGLTLGGTIYTRLNYSASATGTAGNITSSQLGRGTVTIGQSTTDRAQLVVGGNLTVLNPIVFNSSLGTDVVAAIRLAGTNNVFAGTLTAGLADINLGEGNGPATAVLQGQLTGSNGLWVKNSYSSNLTVTLSNTTASLNNYQGNTTVDSRHTLILGAANQIPSGAGYGSMVLSGSLNLGGYSTALNNLSGNGTVEAGGGTPLLTLGATNLSGTFSGVMKNSTGTLSLTKAGSGTLTLSGNDTYSGATTVSAGTLQFAKTAALYNSGTSSWTKENIAVQSGATLALNVGGTGEFATGNVSTLLSNLGGLGGAVNNNGLKSGAIIGFDTTNASGGSFTVADNLADSTGTGGGAIGLTKLGANTLLLTGSNSYTGPTTVSAGVLQFGNTASLYNSGTASWTAANLSVASGATLGLSVGGTGEFSTGHVTTLLGNLGGLGGAVNNNGLKAGANIGFDTTNAPGGTFTIADNIADSTGSGGGAIAVTKLGANTLILTGSNTYSGTTVVGGYGKLIAASSAALGSGTSVLVASTGGGSNTEGLEVAAGVTIAKNVELNGTFGRSNLFLNNGSTWAGNITFTAGNNFSQLWPNNVNSLISGTIFVPGAYDGGSALGVGFRGTGATVSGPIVAGNNKVNIYGGTWTFTNPANTMGSLNVNPGSALNISGSGQLGSSGTFSGPIANNGTFNYNSSANQTLSGVISGAGALQKTSANSGSGTLTISGTANTYTGKTSVGEGTLSVASLNSVTGGSASSSLGAPTTVSNGTIDLGSTGGGGSFYTYLTYTGTGETTDRVLNLISPNVPTTLTQNGTGLLKFTSNLTSSGGRRFTDLAALVLNGSTSGTGEISGAISDATYNVTVAAAAAGSGTLSVTSLIDGNLGWARARLMLSGSGIAPGSYWTAFTSGTGTLSSPTTAPIAAGQQLTLIGTYSVAKYGTSTWTLSGSNTYTGPTTISAGRLQFAKTASLYNSGTASWTAANISVASGATLGLNVGGTGEFATSDVTTLLGNLGGLGGAVNNNGLNAGANIGFDTTNAPGGTFTIADSIANSTGTGGGAIGMSKLGSGQLILTGSNTYTGPTTVNSGTLTVLGTYGSSSHSIASGATLEFNAASGLKDAATTTFTGAGTLRKTGTGALYWGGGAATFALGSGALIDVQAGNLTGGSNNNENWTNNLSDLNVASGASFNGVEAAIRVNRITGSGTLQGGYGTAGSLTIGVDNGSSQFDGTIANAQANLPLIKSGTGTINLTGNSTYTGATTVGAGKLIVSGSLAGTNSLSVSSGAELKVNGRINPASTMNLAGTLSGSGTVGAVSVQIGGILAPGNSPGTLTTGSLSLAGGGSYTLELNSTTGAAGTNWDQMVATTLDLSLLSSSNKFTLTLQTLTSGNASGLLEGFNPASNYTWDGVIKFSSLTGSFNSNLFNIDTAGFLNTNNGNFSVVRNGTQLDIKYETVPEPGVVASLISGLGMLIFLQRRRR